MPYEKLGTFRSTLVFTFLLLGLWYLTWRSSTLAPAAPIFSWTLYLAEIYGFASALLHIFMTWRLTNRHAAPPTPGLSVDVFITTYNEPAELVRKTLLAAKHMDYSHETWLLDEGKRLKLFHRYRFAEQMALKSKTAAQFKKLALRFGFDAFGNHHQAQCFSHRDDGLHMLKIA